jgi:cephalosporin-C deacetylase
VKSGSGAEIAHYLDARPENSEDVMLVLRYFDAMNFAGMIRCGTLIGLGLRDPVVPAETVYSIANHLSAPFEIMEFPVSHSELPEEKRWRNSRPAGSPSGAERQSYVRPSTPTRG